MNICENIVTIRKRFGYSQEEVANKLSISRQTYMKIEKGGDVTIKQLSILANFFGISINEFYYETPNIEKFKQMYKYILSKFGNNGVTKTKLAKLLYLSDFRHFYENLNSMSGVLYKCKEYGPLAEPFLEITDDMFNKGEIKIKEAAGAQIISLNKFVKMNNDLLTDIEKSEIDEIYEAWKDANTQEIVAFTHQQKPWMECRPNEIIPYELILQEDPKHVF